jgi:predicted dehydrogenase
MSTRLKRVGIIGSGKLAFARGKAFLDTGKVQIIGIASKDGLQVKKRLVEKLNIPEPELFDDYDKISFLKPDALLIEVPHYVLGEIIKWGIDVTRGILVGSSLVDNSKEAEEIERKAKERGCLIEAGYDARYSSLWEKVKEIIENKEIGGPVMVQSLALWPGSPTSWYYKQKESGGMPLTHMTYAFINPVRWVLGSVIEVSASANQLLYKEEGFVRQEMCSATLRFQNGSLYSAVAGYISPKDFPRWWIKFICREWGLEFFPLKNILKIYRKEGIEEIDFSSEKSSLLKQAEVFLNALDGKANCLNPIEEARIDIKIAEAIVEAAENHKVMRI